MPAPYNVVTVTIQHSKKLLTAWQNGVIINT